MKNILTLILLTASLSLTACNKQKKDQPSIDENMAPLEQTASLQNESISDEAMPTVNTGAQEQLIAQAGDRVFFGFDSSEVSPEGKAVLAKQAQWLATNNSNVTVEGHCDERGTREYNLALGERRASAVKKFLISQGVAAQRINTISYGKEFPEFLGSSEAAWSKNRRAVTVVNN